MTRSFRTVAALLGTSALALALAGCKIDNRPLLARGDPRPVEAYGPAPGPLDPSSAVAAAYPAPAQVYAWPERAYMVSRRAYARPPSYAFAYGAEQPWAWDVADEGLMFAEPYDEGWRYYYYEPGEDYPYYVQDPEYGYAYGDDGALLAMFDAAGALISTDRYRNFAPRAGDYWTRAHDLNRSYRRSPRQPVEPAAWRRWAPAMLAAQDRWHRAYARQPGWRDAAQHDNGRHLGWEGSRNNGGRRTEMREAEGRRAEPAWRQARAPELHAPAAGGPGAEDRGRRGRPETELRPRHDQGGGHGGGQPGWPQAQGAEAHGRAGWRGSAAHGVPGAGGHGAGQAGWRQAQGAEVHGRNAAWRGGAAREAPAAGGHGGGQGAGGAGGGGGHGHGGGGGGGGGGGHSGHRGGDKDH